MYVLIHFIVVAAITIRIVIVYAITTATTNRARLGIISLDNIVFEIIKQSLSTESGRR